MIAKMLFLFFSMSEYFLGAKYLANPKEQMRSLLGAKSRDVRTNFESGKGALYFWWHYYHNPPVTSVSGVLAEIASLFNKNRFKRVGRVVQGKPVFQEIITGQFWYLDNFHKNEYEVFNERKEHIGTANLKGVLNTDNAENKRTLSI